jgi:hypothetical protein
LNTDDRNFDAVRFSVYLFRVYELGRNLGSIKNIALRDIGGEELDGVARWSILSLNFIYPAV